MKRSVNFSGPRKFAALAAMRQATTETWLAEPSTETANRRDADCDLLKAHRLTNLAIALDVACNSVSNSEPRRNVGDLIYAGYDQGWRAHGLHEFEGPEGQTHKAPSMMWVDAMRAIREAAAIRARGEGGNHG